MKIYAFTGAVYVFGRLVTSKWEASTVAATEARAMSNLKFRFRKDNNFCPTVPVKLSGSVKQEAV